MRTEDLDNIEETLRNDLRRDGQRHVISSNGNQDKIALKVKSRNLLNIVKILE